jgi:ABC-2 type transport system ATP-binding protein
MITAHSLTKRYGADTAVDHLTFEVPAGVVTGFLGPNGSGKSTAMRMIMGLDYPDSGSALIGGKPYNELAWPLREVGGLLDAKAGAGRSGWSPPTGPPSPRPLARSGQRSVPERAVR